MCRNLLSEKSKVNVYSLADLAAILDYLGRWSNRSAQPAFNGGLHVSNHAWNYLRTHLRRTLCRLNDSVVLP